MKTYDCILLTPRGWSRKKVSKDIKEFDYDSIESLVFEGRKPGLVDFASRSVKEKEYAFFYDDSFLGSCLKTVAHSYDVDASLTPIEKLCGNVVVLGLKKDGSVRSLSDSEMTAIEGSISKEGGVLVYRFTKPGRRKR